jgi:hypothetical protein
VVEDLLNDPAGVPSSMLGPVAVRRRFRDLEVGSDVGPTVARARPTASGNQRGHAEASRKWQRLGWRLRGNPLFATRVNGRQGRCPSSGQNGAARPLPLAGALPLPPRRGRETEHNPVRTTRVSATPASGTLGIARGSPGGFRIDQECPRLSAQPTFERNASDAMNLVPSPTGGF